MSNPLCVDLVVGHIKEHMHAGVHQAVASMLPCWWWWFTGRAVPQCLPPLHPTPPVTISSW